MKNCAYCEIECTPTKEHIWPKSLIEKYEQKLLAYNKRTNSLLPIQPMIKDVCANCNNVLLSALDSYLSGLYDNKLSGLLSPGDSASIQFNYELLIRSLLKISFNSARASSNNKALKAHSLHKKFIINGGHLFNAQLRLQIVTSSRAVNLDDDTSTDFPVSQLRCCDINYTGKLSNRFIVRLIAINCYFFYIILSLKREPEHKWNQFIEGFSSWKIPIGIELNQKMNSLEIPVNKTTYMHPDYWGTILEVNT